MSGEKLTPWAQHYPPKIVQAIARSIRRSTGGNQTASDVAIALYDASAKGPSGESWATIAKRILANLGHPDLEKSTFVLKMGRARPELTAATKEVICKCEVRAATRSQRSMPPSKLPKTMSFEFNHTMGMDILYLDTRWDNAEQQRKKDTLFLDMVDWGTGRQVVVRIPDREIGTLRDFYRPYWLRPYGRPKVLVSDQEKGILRGVFADRASAGWHGARPDGRGERVPRTARPRWQVECGSGPTPRSDSPLRS